MEVFQNASKNKVLVFCWSSYCFLVGRSDADNKHYCCPCCSPAATFRPRAPERLSGKSADRSLIQISLWLEGETHSILHRCHFELEASSCFSVSDFVVISFLFFLNQARQGWIIGRPAALDWLALRSGQRAPLPKLRSADTSVPSPPAPGPLPALA